MNNIVNRIADSKTIKDDARLASAVYNDECKELVINKYSDFVV